MFIVQLLILERNRELVTRNRSSTLHQRLHLLFRQSDQQDAVLACIGMKNIGKGGCDDAAKAVIRKRPGCMLTRGSTAEVLPRNQNFRALVVRTIQNKIRM